MFLNYLFVYLFDRDTHQIKSKTEQTSLANGGPQCV